MNKKVLVLCTGNSCRSQIAEGYLRYYATPDTDIYSAGVEAHGVNPNAVATMLADDIDISAHTSNLVEEYSDINFDVLITVCDRAVERCPIFVSSAKKYHYNFEDPAKVQGSQDEVAAVFARVRDEIKAYCKGIVEEQGL